MRIIDAEKPGFDKFLKKRRLNQSGVSEKIRKAIKGILSDVVSSGDKAVSFYTEKFDGVKLSPDNFLISEKEKKNAISSLTAENRKILEDTIKRVYDYHSAQKLQTWLSHGEEGLVTGQIIAPLKRIGMYVPGGKASYPSSVIMNAVPASAAGVEEIIMVTPPSDKLNSIVIAAAVMCGVKTIFRIGGPQAVFALAYGTETIPRVDKIVGPGNIYVATAKRMVYGDVDIDMIAGPSEIAIVCDGSASPELAAIDMLSQAEHDEMAIASVISDSRKLLNGVKAVLPELIAKESRRDIISRSIQSNAALIKTNSVERSIEIANELAPEHLELYIQNPFEKMFLVKNAGAVFLGGNTPEAVGDYIAGPSHVLPTGGTARFFSPLDTLSFMKRTSVISASSEFIKKRSKDIAFFSGAEGLSAHGKSVLLRMEREEEEQ